jgi:protein SCO1/2
MTRRVAALFLVIFGLFFVAACSNAKHYEMKGQVLAVDRDKVEILVKHEDIPGLMPAMTMPYKVESVSMLDNIGPGDLISTDLAVDNGTGVITKITKTGTAKVDTPAPSPIASGFELIKVGAEVPNQIFIDQDGKERHLNDIRDGHAMALTFIYTKCPMPTYCPMMDRQFATIQKEIQTKPELRDKARLLSVSFDPKNDTPPVLKKHAKELGADPKLWTFVTGNRDDIDKFAMTFGVTLIRGEASDPNEIGHTLRTAIIDRSGKLVKTYTGNEWSASDIVADLEKVQ